MRKRITYLALIIVCAFGAMMFQHGNDVKRGGVSGDVLVSLLGGFRGVAAEVVWFKADRLQMAGRWTELAQLYAILTHLEPQTPEVWSYAAWNLAYNIPVMLVSAEDRWRWVHAGLKLLRDDALSINPREPELYYETALMFLMKVGDERKLDNASEVYRNRWAEIVRDVSARDAWKELSMDHGFMEAIESRYGKIDWTDARASALYWAAKGLFCVRTERDRIRLETVVDLSLKRMRIGT